MRPRRVDTGHDDRGRSVVLPDRPPPVIQETPTSDATFAEIWNTKEAPALIASLSPEPTKGAIRVPPDAGGTIARLVELKPRSRSPMHRSETVDYGVVIEGEVFLILDDSEVLLEPGTVVVQRGTDHAWENRSDRPALLCFVLVDGRFSDEVRSVLSPDAIARLYNAPLATADRAS